MTIEEKRLAKWHSYSDFFHFTNEQEENLLEMAGYDYFSSEKDFKESITNLEKNEAEIEKNNYTRGIQLLTNIRFYLGLYDESVKNIDNAPTQKEICEQFENLRRTGYHFYEQLIALGMHQRGELELEDYDIYSLKKPLASFLTVTGKIASKNIRESRGRKKAVTRKAIINHLAIEFDRYCIGEHTENSKIEFIGLALDYAKIERPKNIKRLFYRINEKKVYFKQIQ